MRALNPLALSAARQIVSHEICKLQKFSSELRVFPELEALLLFLFVLYFLFIHFLTFIILWRVYFYMTAHSSTHRMHCVL